MEDGEIEEGMMTAEEGLPRSEVAPETIAPPRKAEKSPLELLRESKTLVEEIIARMLSIKKEGNHKSEIRELLTQMFLNFVNLRQVISSTIKIISRVLQSLSITNLRVLFRSLLGRRIARF